MFAHFYLIDNFFIAKILYFAVFHKIQIFSFQMIYYNIQSPMIKPTILILLLALTFARNYPMYKQCDSRWANDQLGTSSNTICKAGCLMSSAAMALSGTGHTQDPKSLNTWLKSNGGYVSGDLFVWGAINKIGLTYKGHVANSQIKRNLDAGNVVILNVHNGGHWVLAHGYSGDNILVNDPGYSTTQYSLSEIVNGNTGVYSVNALPNWLNNFISDVQDYFTGSSVNLETAPAHVQTTQIRQE